ncbi:MAG: hypothetical protein H7308_07070 [Chthonomonadaceae bacterium]|nr:hypothetical protein [Chthonomonadaceae bacterium]
MNETERERIIRMVSEGTLRPEEAASLLAALAAGHTPVAESVNSAQQKSKTAQEKSDESAKTVMHDVEFRRPDGTSYSVQVPPHLIAAFMKIAAVQLKEASKIAAQDAWVGLKTMTRNKVTETKQNLKDRVTGKTKKAEEAVFVPDPAMTRKTDARHQIVQMVQNGRISPEEGAKLLEQIG